VICHKQAQSNVVAIAALQIVRTVRQSSCPPVAVPLSDPYGGRPTHLLANDHCGTEWIGRTARMYQRCFDRTGRGSGTMPTGVIERDDETREAGFAS
jgi:hypothetical protein